ncbi:MAG: transglutaminase-like domain-containing protein [Acidobacteriota bacterium]
MVLAVTSWNGTRSVSRRSFLRVAGSGGAGLLFGYKMPLAAGRHSLDLASFARMDFDVTYHTEIMNLPRDAKEVHVWMPLPPSDDAQEITHLSVSCPLPYKITCADPYGNRMVHVGIEEKPEPFTVKAHYRVARKRIGATPAELDPRRAEKYLKLTSRVRITDEVAAFAEKTLGESKQPYEVGKKVFGAIIDLLSYDKTIPGCGTGDTAWIMRHRRGKCDDYHALFMAVLISRGIPVRWEQGFPLPLPTAPARDDAARGRLEGDCSGAHCWASFHDPSRGWVPVDVSAADKAGANGSYYFGHLTPNRFKISEGRSVMLNPAQGGDPLPTFAYAYAEADGIPLIYGANYENTIKYVVKRVETF